MDITISTENYDALPFAEAFASARSVLDNAGIFYWHGRPFNTLLDSEINGMDTEQWSAFSDSIKTALVGFEADGGLSGLAMNTVAPAMSIVDSSDLAGLYETVAEDGGSWSAFFSHILTGVLEVFSEP